MLQDQNVMDKKLQRLTYILVGLLLSILGLAFALGLAAYILYKPVMATHYYNKGVEEKENGWVKSSKEYLQLAIKTDKKGSVAKKAKHYLDTRLPKSDNISDNAIQLNIKGYNARVNNNVKAAEEFFNKAIADSPEFEWPYSNLANLYFYKLNDNDKAISYYNKALELNPNYLNARWGLAKVYFEKARMLIKEKKYSEALKILNTSKKEYTRVTSLEPDNFEIKEDSKDLEEYIKFVEKKLK